MDLFTIVGWAVIGLVAGGVAKLIMPGRDPGGCLVTILLGIAGAFVAGFIANQMNWTIQGTWGSLIAATLGAILLLILYRLLFRRRY